MMSVPSPSESTSRRSGAMGPPPPWQIDCTSQVLSSRRSGKGSQGSRAGGGGAAGCGGGGATAWLPRQACCVQPQRRTRPARNRGSSPTLRTRGGSIRSGHHRASRTVRVPPVLRRGNPTRGSPALDRRYHSRPDQVAAARRRLAQVQALARMPAARRRAPGRSDPHRARSRVRSSPWDPQRRSCCRSHNQRGSRAARARARDVPPLAAYHHRIDVTTAAASSCGAGAAVP
jgi:hypothetical protein